jgi:exonuclease SbcC
METMFMDEGFGSLDAETLDKAMVVLQQLTGSHRLIGIVSHVEALKERIDKKIVVEKLNGGKSVLKLIA